MSDGEIAQIPEELDNYFYDTMDWGWTTDEEYALMAKLKKGKAKAEGKEVEKSQKSAKSETDIGNAEKDKEFMRSTFAYNDKLKDAVGKNKINNENDVKLVASKLKFLGIKDIPEDCIVKGKWKNELTKKIKEFQKNYPGVRAHNKKLARKPNGIVEPDGATFKALVFNTGLQPIYASRKEVNSHIKTDDLVTSISAPVGKGKKNNQEDVKTIAELLVENKISNIPVKSLDEGQWDDQLTDKIKEFQGNQKLTKAGYVNHTGTTIKRLAMVRLNKSKINQMIYNMGSGKHKSLDNRADYEEKINKVQEDLGIEKDSKLGRIIKMANKAATDQKYFSEITNNVSEKLTNIEKNRKDGGVTLSPVLEDRMSRFHKFLVAAGLYKGNMWVSDGARSPERAHRWCVQWIIENKSESHSYVKAIKENLIMMYNNKIYHSGEYIKDSDNNLWAKKEHFSKDDKGNVSIDWEKVKKYVINYADKHSKLFRRNSSAPASEGYSETSKRLPNKSGSSPSITNHKTGEAIDINSNGFIMKTEAIIDLIGLCFGVIRDGGSTEYWHFEMTGVEISNKKKENKKTKNN
jgi:hypothetical protein